MTPEQFDALLDKVMALQTRVVNQEDNIPDDELVGLLDDAMSIVTLLVDVIESKGPLNLS